MHHASFSCKQPRKRYTRDSDADKFRGSSLWQRTRTNVRERDMNLCVLCASQTPPIYVTTGLSVHHIVPLEQGGDRVAPSNLITLCSSCHELAERGDVSRDELRALVRSMGQRN